MTNSVLGVRNIQHTNGTNAMTIDSTGRVAMPNMPGFSAKGQTAAWRTLPDASQWTQFVGGTTHTTGQSGNLLNKYAVDWTDASGGGLGDTNNNFDAGTGLFTAPVSGLYYFHFGAYGHKLSTGAGNYCHINSVINGTIQPDYTIFGHQATNEYFTVDLNRQWFLSANQTFQFTIHQNVANTVSFYAAYIFFSGYLVG